MAVPVMLCHHYHHFINGNLQVKSIFVTSLNPLVSSLTSLKHYYACKTCKGSYILISQLYLRLLMAVLCLVFFLCSVQGRKVSCLCGAAAVLCNYIIVCVYFGIYFEAVEPQSLFLHQLKLYISGFTE